MDSGSFPIPVHPTPGRGAANSASQHGPAEASAEKGLPTENDFDQVWDRAMNGKSPGGKALAKSGPSGEEVGPPVEPADPSEEVGVAPVIPMVVTEAPSVPDPHLSAQLLPGPGQMSPDRSLSPEGPLVPGEPTATDKVLLTPIMPRPTGEQVATGSPQVATGSATASATARPEAALPSEDAVQVPRGPARPPPKVPAAPDERVVAGQIRSSGPEAAKIAPPQGAGNAGSAGSEMKGSGKENFLTPDSHKVSSEGVKDGIADALSGTRMRRPQENNNPMTTPLNQHSRLGDGTFNLASSPVAAGSMARIPSGRVESESRKIDLSALDTRPAVGSAMAETRSVATGMTSALQAPRQAEAASVLESIHRMAEKASARSQDRLSMTLRFEDGSSVRIRLIREGGEFRTVIHTDQPGMETALRQQWSQFSQDAGDRGFKFLSMSFADLGGSADQHRSPNGENAQGDFSELVAGVPTAHPAAVSTDSEPHRSDRSSTASTSGSGRLRAWV